MMRPLLAAVLLTAAGAAAAEAPAPRAAPTAAAPPAAAPTADLARFSGLYHGVIAYRPAELELECIVELGLAAAGGLAGTIDQPGYFEYQPLAKIDVEGDEIRFVYHFFSELRGPDTEFVFEGRLVDGGAAIAGEFLDSRGRTPFRFERIGDAGDERPTMTRRPLADLAASGEELRAAFNADADGARLVLLLSPRCGVCLLSSRLIGRYLTSQVDDERLALYVVWGPMLGDETRDHAVDATAFLDDPRARHFWTPGHEVAALFHPATGLPADERAWDTFHLYAPGARWDEAPPAPVAVWHVKKPLPEEQTLNGVELRDRVRALLAGDARPAAAR
jgi:hypothetical protein